jgi:hypothetical protein
MNPDILQPFTQFGQFMTDLLEKIKPKEEASIEEIRTVNTMQNDSFEGIQDVLMMRMASEFTDDMILNEGGTPEQDENRTIQFQRNQNILKKALIGYIAAHGVLPSTTALAKITGLSRPTIQNHLKEDVLNMFFKQELSKVQLLTTDLVVKLYQLAQGGDLRAIKLLFDIMVSGQKMQVPQQTNYIQINNLRVQNQNIDKLSPKSKAKIEKIIRNDLHLKS